MRTAPPFADQNLHNPVYLMARRAERIAELERMFKGGGTHAF
ncbi:hypothetical protein AB0O64_12895 [Streptomyces sp. NPDC088341]